MTWKQKIVVLIYSCLLVLNYGCKKSETHRSKDTVSYYSTEYGYKDGIYCAEVEYYNSSTGTRRTYDLDVEVEDGELTIIHWPNGGWLDDTHFYPEDITSGECEFTSDRGYHYTVTLSEFGGCGYTDKYLIQRDVNYDVEATTCPRCGNEKDEYDNYCYSCKITIEDQEENTCSRCGSYEYGVYGGLCSSCTNEDDEW